MMAEIKCKLIALGSEPPCNGCEKKFVRGETMNSVEYKDGQPAGWFCDTCINDWKSGKLFEP